MSGPQSHTKHTLMLHCTKDEPSGLGQMAPRHRYPHLPTCRLLDTQYVATCYLSQCRFRGQEWGRGGLYRKDGEAELSGMGLA